MIARHWVWLVAGLIFLSLGFAVAEYQRSANDDAFRRATRVSEACFLARRIEAGQGPYDRPSPAVEAECFRPVQDAIASRREPWLIGPGAGLVAALAFVLVVFGWRRATASRGDTG